jgi:hypothetical protein
MKIDLLTLHAHNKKCKSCGRFDNYIYVHAVLCMYFKNVVHATITTNCPYCGRGYIIETITERTD